MNQNHFKRCRLLYGNITKPFSAAFSLNGKPPLRFDSIQSSGDLQIREWDLEGPVNKIGLYFKGKESPDVYAIAVDDYQGVAVDNVSLRGSSGLEFTKGDLVMLGKAYQMLNVKLLILEFGVNVVPYVVDNYDYYEKCFYNQLRALKKIDPELSIIVIGTSDMAQKVGDHYESYGNVGKIRDAQRNAAFRAGCAFWDLYEAMGGWNSMPSWVFADPPLAGKDFTHFNQHGASIIAAMFYNALVDEYNHYITNCQNPVLSRN